MQIKIEFRHGGYLVLNAGGLYQSTDECQDAFLRLLNGSDRFFKFVDHLGRKKIISRDNVNSIDIGYVKREVHGK